MYFTLFQPSLNKMQLISGTRRTRMHEDHHVTSKVNPLMPKRRIIKQFSYNINIFIWIFSNSVYILKIPII